MSRALTYVEIDVDYCSRTYGVAPCTARLGETGSNKCFNSLKTCQDVDNFSDVPRTVRYGMAVDYLPASIDCIPSIKKVDFTPATISLGSNLGQRATVTVEFYDGRDTDTGILLDKYLSDRNYIPFDRGTYWGKFRARRPYLRGRTLKLINGIEGQTISEMETRYYVIESIEGPTTDGVFRIVAKDILKFADGDRAQAPALSSGYLSADINSSTTSATLAPTGIGNAEYPSSGYIAIGGKEICSFTRSGDSLTITRGQLNTTGTALKSGDRVQVVLAYSGISPELIIQELLVTYAGVPSSYITIADWSSEISNFLAVVYTAYITEPTSVATLISELIEQAALSLWWDDQARKIRLQVLRGVTTDAATYDDDVIIDKSLNVNEQPDKRVSRVQTYFGQINPLRPLTDLDNFRSSTSLVDDLAETQYGSSAIKNIYSRWIPQGGRAVADKLNSKVISRYRDPPRKFEYSLLRGVSLVDPKLGGGYNLRSFIFQDDTGDEVDVPTQVTRLKPAADRFVVEAEEMLYTASDEELTERLIIIETDTLNVNLRTIHDTLYPEPVSGDEVTCQINSGVKVGSSSTGSPAFNVGSWPSGVTVNLVVNGRIQGCGGKGGHGGDIITNGSITAGLPGGTALYTRYAINVEYGVGAQIWGGGGGGGGGVGSTFGGGVGGGGGAGQSPGAVGANGAGASVILAPSAGTTEAGGAGGTALSGSSGAGGGPGLAGATAGSMAGGSAGSAIDGVSYRTVISGSADIRGSTIN